MKIVITEQQLDKIYCEYINFLTKDLVKVRPNKFPDHTFLVDNGKIILHQYPNGVVTYSYGFFKDFKTFFDLEHEEFLKKLKNCLNKQLNIKIKKIGIPFIDSGQWDKIISMEI